MFSSPEIKDPIILDPGKKVTQYQSIPFSHGLKQNSFVLKLYVGFKRLDMPPIIFGAIPFLTINISVNRTCRYLTWILTAMS